jgi:hypothetical protein
MAFHGFLQANTAVDVLIGPFVDNTDGDTALTSLTLSQADIKLSKEGQTLAQKNDATAAASDANGYYNCELDATDTNTEGTLVLIVHETGALPVRHDFLVVNQAAYASLVTAKDTGYMDTNVKAISDAILLTLGIKGYGTAQSAATANVVVAAATGALYKVGDLILVTGSDQGYSQTRLILGVSTDTLTVDDWTVVPSGTITYVGFNAAPASTTVFPGVNIEQINGVAITGDGSGSPFDV